MTTTNRLISPEYLAGFFDGEGTFHMSLQKSKHPSNQKLYPHATIILSQSGDDGLKLLKTIQEQYGGNIYEHLKTGQYKATKNAYKLYWNKKEGIVLCKLLIPFLVLKKKQAQTVLDYLTRN